MVDGKPLDLRRRYEENRAQGRYGPPGRPCGLDPGDRRRGHLAGFPNVPKRLRDESNPAEQREQSILLQCDDLGKGRRLRKIGTSPGRAGKDLLRYGGFCESESLPGSGAGHRSLTQTSA